MISQNKLRRTVQIIADYYAPDHVYLFGSQSKGTSSEVSDIDMLIIKDTPLPREQRGLEIAGLLANQSHPVDMLFITPEELEQELKVKHSFIGSIWKNSIKIL
jgi:uncharacterized protein